MSVREYWKIKKPKGRSKYGNRNVKVDGNIFDSQAEARYYQELKLLARAEEIFLSLTA